MSEIDDWLESQCECGMSLDPQRMCPACKTSAYLKHLERVVEAARPFAKHAKSAPERGGVLHGIFTSSKDGHTQSRITFEQLHALRTALKEMERAGG